MISKIKFSKSIKEKLRAKRESKKLELAKPLKITKEARRPLTW